jgi:hypothetical protein
LYIFLLVGWNRIFLILVNAEFYVNFFKCNSCVLIVYSLLKLIIYWLSGNLFGLVIKIILFFQSPLLLYGLDKNYDVFVNVKGGGLSGQSDAILCLLIK